MRDEKLAPRGGIWFFGLIAAIFSLGVAQKIHAPLTYWDSALLEWALSQAPSKPPAGTSPLYLISLRAMASAGWLEPAGLRWFQAGGAILSGILTCYLAVRLWGEPRAGALAFSMYVLHPAVLQGSHSLDMADASFYPGFFALWILEFISRRPGDWRRFARLALWSALAMGWKTTSSLGLLLYPLFGMLRSLFSEGKPGPQWRDFLATLVGLLVFALPWWSLQRWEPLDASISTAAGAFRLRAPAAIAFHAALGIAWWGPFLAALAGWGAIALGARGKRRLESLIGGTALYLVGYLLAGGMNYGFPRYYLGVLPILCSLSACPAFVPEKNARSLGAFLLLTASFWAWVGDPIYALNLQAREALLHQTLLSHLGRMALIWSAWMGAAAAVKWVSGIAWPRFLIILVFANVVGLALLQGSAAYVTSYGYGEEGRRRVLEWVRRTIPSHSSILAPPNLAAEMKEMGYRGAGHADWKTRDSVLAFIRRARPRGMVLSLSENAMWQLKWLLEEPPREFGPCRERIVRIGTFWACALE